MASTGDRHDPFFAFNFVLTFTNWAEAGFSECSGLELTTDVFEYAEGGQNQWMHKFPGRIKQVNLTLKRGIADRQVWDWYWEIVEGKVTRRTGTLTVRDQSGTQDVMQYEFQSAFPARWVGPQLNATQNAVAVETLELAYQGIVRKK